jgi:hypothetical protein
MAAIRPRGGAFAWRWTGWRPIAGDGSWDVARRETLIMHSTEDLASDSFVITVEGRRATFAEVFADFEERDRLGVVLRQPCGAVGASTLILAAVTAFYDFQRARSREFFAYPDYYLFHVGWPLGNHAMLDIWPGHKEVVVADEPEELLRAINDRAISRLLVEDGTPGAPRFERQTMASTRLRTALAYSPEGRVRDADVTVAGNAATEAYVAAVLEKSDQIAVEARAGIRARRSGLLEHGVPVESYRRLSVAEALARLAPQPAP